MRLFHEIKHLSQEQQRTELNKTEDDRIRQRVENMLNVLESTESFFDKPLTDRLMTDHDIEVDAYIGKSIGGYEIVDLIAQGGMGYVFRGVRLEPVKREVAIKIIHTEADDALIQWFNLEQQNLLKLNHPNIASVYDVGVSEDGIPFIIMEEVKGVAISDFCDQENLTIAQRLDLFLAVCKAVQYCHQRGIIHCDLKSSNILVRKIEDDCVVKIIDFGLASVTGHTIQFSTEQYRFMGTPEYMSPEFTDEDVLIDIRIDVYSLGALLYALLCGELPFSRNTLVDANLSNTLENIRNKAVIGMPQKFNELSFEDQQEHAKNRDSHANQLKKTLKSDLNAICLKALSRDRDQRYQSLYELISDVDNYLNTRPVMARQTGWYETMNKFVQRHKWMTLLSAVFVVMVMLFTVTVLNQSRTIKAQYKISEQERQTAIEEKEAAEQVTQLMVGIFKSGDPFVEHSDAVDIKKLLANGVEQIDAAVDTPLHIKNRLLISISQVYTNLGLQQQALDILERLLQQDQFVAVETKIQVMHYLTHNLTLIGRHEEAVASGYKTLKLAEEIPDLTTLLLAESKIVLGRALQGGDQLQKAIVYLNDALVDLEAQDGQYEAELIQLSSDIGLGYVVLEEIEKAETYLRKSYQRARDFYPNNHLSVASIQMALAQALHRTNQVEEAIFLAQASSQILLQRLGSAHPETITNRANLSSIYSSDGQFDEAIEVQLLNLQASEEYYGYESAEHIKHLTVLGNLYENSQQNEKAFEVRSEIYPLALQVIPDNSQLLGVVAFNLGASQISVGQYTEAIVSLDVAERELKKIVGDDHVTIAMTVHEKAMAYAYLKRFDEVAKLEEFVLSVYAKNLADDNWRYLLAQATYFYAQYQLTQDQEMLDSLQQTQQKLLSLGSGYQRFAGLVGRWLSEVT